MAKKNSPQLPRAGWTTTLLPQCLADLQHWVATDRNIALRILTLIEAIARDPFSGIGKPEPLKGLGPGVWSRRITQEHRLVYEVRNGQINFLQARYHYSK